MNEQYEMVSAMQTYFGPLGVGDIRRLKLEFLLFRLKRLLLKMESCPPAEMAMLCPLKELELLTEKFGRLATDPDSIEQLEDGLKLIVHRLETIDDSMQLNPGM